MCMQDGCSLAHKQCPNCLQLLQFLKESERNWTSKSSPQESVLWWAQRAIILVVDQRNGEAKARRFAAACFWCPDKKPRPEFFLLKLPLVTDGFVFHTVVSFHPTEIATIDLWCLQPEAHPCKLFLNIISFSSLRSAVTNGTKVCHRGLVT